jgi:DNA-binding transcriptional MerR regulator
MTERFTDTTTELARLARVTQPTVRTYAAAGLLEYITASDGTLLFRTGQAERVREIYAQRMANRGRKSAEAA